MPARIQVHPMSVGPFGGLGFQLFCAPYPLGCLLAYLGSRGLGDRFDLGAITPVSRDQAVRGLDRLTGPGIFLFSSYVWNHAANVEVAEHVKRRSPRSLVVFGGPHLPRRQEALRAFFDAHPAVDVVVRGEGEEALAEVLAAIRAADVPPEAMRRADLSAVGGITYRQDGLRENPDRERPRSLDDFPSPYALGLFDHWIDGTNYMPLETNRGCPYGCTFCDWGAATLSKMRPFPLERVFADIEYAGAHRLETVYLCDANFGMFGRDVEIAERLAAVHRRCGYPKIVSYNAAKTIREPLRRIVMVLKEAGLITHGMISLQTTDSVTLANIHRSNIKLSEYDKLIAHFREERISGVSELMVGLPGQTMDTCRRDLQFLFDRRIHARIFATILMPNAPMAEPAYRAEHAIEADADGFVQATRSFSREDFARMSDLCRAYKLLANTGSSLAKYLLLFLQVDHGLSALDVVAAWLAAASGDGTRFPVSHRLWTTVLARPLSGRARDALLVAWNDDEAGVVFDDVDGLLRELLAVCRTISGAALEGSDVEALLAAQRAVLPGRDAEPGVVALEHDVPAYFEAIRAAVSVGEPGWQVPPLRAYGPGALRVDEARPGRAFDDFGAPAVGFELRSDLAL